MNYLYLKPSSDSPKVGDLTTEGLITDISPDGDGFIIQGDKKLDVCELAMLHMDIKILIPLLIMDAPDNIMQSFLNNQGKIGAIIFFDEGKIIPFHSNEQVFEYLKSKGIKPEAEMLIEFDGEVELEPIWCESFCKTHFCAIDNCKNKDKYDFAIIKDTEVRQESEENIWNSFFMMQFELSMKGEDQYIESILKQHFKIERR